MVLLWANDAKCGLECLRSAMLPRPLDLGEYLSDRDFLILGVRGRERSLRAFLGDVDSVRSVNVPPGALEVNSGQVEVFVLNVSRAVITFPDGRTTGNEMLLLLLPL